MLEKLKAFWHRWSGRGQTGADQPEEIKPAGDGLDCRLQALLPLLSLPGEEPDACELADVLWLAVHLDPPPALVRQEQAREDRPKREPAEAKPTTASVRQASPPPPASRPEREAAQCEIYPQAGSRSGQRPALGFRAPAVPSLPNALALSRSLKPLRRKLPSRTRRHLDEDATAEGIAGQRLAKHSFWEPVWMPAREPWFELNLVVDGGATMVVWRQVIDEFRRLLENNGAFRRVRVYRLLTDGPEPMLRLGLDAQSRKSHSPAQLLSGSARPLVLLLSDCVGPAWHTGAVNDWLRLWAKASPLAVLQMLPRRLWDGSALGRGEFLRLFSRVAAPTAGKLEGLDTGPAKRSKLNKKAATTDLRFPVLTLDASALHTWGKLLGGRREAWCAGVAFGDPGAFAPKRLPVTYKEPDEQEIGRRFADFLADASPLARRLAGLLAAAPLTLPVMQLVQRRLLRDSGQSHLAEIFLSGLICRKPELETENGEPFYDFRVGARRRLLDLIGERDSKQVLCQVSAFVAERTGRVLDFAALIAAPSDYAWAGASLNLDDANTRHFAEIGATVLRRLGGSYARLAEALDSIADGRLPYRPPVTQEQDAKPAPTLFHDSYRDGQEGPAMVWLPGGKFMMGSPEGVGNNDEHPQHEVTLDHYAVGQYPVTVGEFRRFVEETGYRTEAEQGDGAYVWNKGYDKIKDASWRNPYFDQTEQNPVVCLSWNDAQAYCDWLVGQTGQTYGLLTEAQWEYACRSGSTTRYCYGDDESGLDEYAWYSKNANSQTHPVGKKKPNAWQLYDLHGNVWEWCEDWYDSKYYVGCAEERSLSRAKPKDASIATDAPSASAQPTISTGGFVGHDEAVPDLPLMSKPQHTASASEQSASGSASGRTIPPFAKGGLGGISSENPSGPASGSYRVVRSGSWSLVADNCRSAFRNWYVPSFRNYYLGFRLSRTGPLHSYPFTLGSTELEKPTVPAFIAGLRDPLTDGTEGPAMVWLPGGEFMMGQDDSPYDDEKPAHPVRVDAISIGQYPVTFAEYDRFCLATQRKPPDDRSWGRGDRPAINVSWQDAMDYCAWLGLQTGEHYRLATEAEWEYACRSGSTTRYCYGDDESRLGEYAWYSNNANRQTHPVGQKNPNAWQLYDLHGNVREWCADWYAEDYYAQLAGHSQHTASTSEQSASGSASEHPIPPFEKGGSGGISSENSSGPASGSGRVVRSGSWGSGADNCRSANRSGIVPSDRDFFLGFRLSRTGPWRSHPVTLGAAPIVPTLQRGNADSDAPASPDREAVQPGFHAGASEPAETKPRFQDYEVFHDSPARDATDGEGPAMVYLPGGTFLMGDEKGSDDEKPVHPVRLSAFAMGQTPVTIGEYLKFCQATDSHWPEWLKPGSQYHIATGNNDYYRKRGITLRELSADEKRDGTRNYSGLDPQCLDLLIVGIFWDDASAYCQWLSEATGETYALPTEAQWEYACRGGNPGRWCFGDDEKLLAEYAWYDKNSKNKLHPVMGKAANAFGLYDVHGNVWEWCADWYSNDYYTQLAGHSQHTASASEQSASGSASEHSIPPFEKGGLGGILSENPSGPASGSFRVVRGGSWIYDAVNCRSANRYSNAPSVRNNGIGFRLSRTV